VATIVNDVVIKAENLGKKYVIGHAARRGQNATFREVLMLNARSVWHKMGDLAQGRPIIQGEEQEEVWAVKDVSFEISRGEVVGIIGRNGAGKSTLLKVLSRITEPSTGRVTIKGRVASLLEAGTGFHPELTGRENVFLNGAILGMTRAEIKRRFDEIVAFAEIEKFLDTPVKRYSSGMYVRLAFAVAAHLEPEILIVDEVLAVGDAQFQKKCLGKMKEVATGQGRTVLFVSHIMTAVTRLCQRAILLADGRVADSGEAHRICSRYLSDRGPAPSQRQWPDPSQAPGNTWVRFVAAEVASHGQGGDTCDIRQPLTIRLSYEVLKAGKVIIPNIHLYAEDGTVILIAHDWSAEWRRQPKKPGHYMTEFLFPGNFFSEGRVGVRTVLSTYFPFEVHADVSDALSFHVVDSLDGDSARGDWAGAYPGVIRPLIPSRTRQF
jgi:lipopolysaccharide transport system ATP-binding protein